MNPFIFLTIWSFKRELTYVLIAFLIALLIPIVAIIILTQTGINLISDRLATQNPQNQSVDIHDPATGKVIKNIKLDTVWPAHGYVTLEFGVPDLPYQPLHSGIDIADKKGDPITAFTPGKVIYAGEIFWGFGKHIIIDHGNNITSIYGHLDKIFVIAGEEIKTTDQVIGLEGSTGWSTGPHVHFQIDVFGIPVNPRTFIPGNP